MWQFASESPWLAFFLALIAAECITECVKYITRAFRKGD